MKNSLYSPKERLIMACILKAMRKAKQLLKKGVKL